MIHVHKAKHQVQKPNVIALSAQEAQWVRLASATNNLANANTPGFKSHLVKLVQTTQKGKDGKLINFVSANKSLRNTSDGAFRKTDNPLDVSLNGKGYFKVQTPKGECLTRNGQFAINAKNELVTADGGYQVSDQTGSPIILPSGAKQLIINTQGSVYVNSKLIGTIGVFTVENEQEKLKNLGNNLLKPVGQTAEIATKYYIKQFGLEDSNVSAIKESVLMIEILRQYEHAQKIIDEHEQSNKKMLNVSSKNV